MYKMINADRFLIQDNECVTKCSKDYEINRHGRCEFCGNGCKKSK